MTDVAVKRRMARAKDFAIKKFEDMGYKIIPSDNSLFCFIAIRKMEIRMVRVAMDIISPKDIESVKGFAPPGICSKEIWCRKGNRFEIQEVL